MASRICDLLRASLRYTPITGNRDENKEEPMPNRVIHFEIISPEAERLQKFFSDVFQWAINTANPMNYGMVNTGAKDYGIQGGIGAPGPFGSGHITFYIEVDDVDAALAKAVAAGGTVAMPKITLPGGEPGNESILAQFTDPLGNRYGLSQRHAPPPKPRAAASKAAKKAAPKPKAKPKAKAKPAGKAKAKKRGRR
jgi:uncharacterized protein